MSIYQKSLLKGGQDTKFDKYEDDDCNDGLVDVDEAELIQKGLLDMTEDELDDDQEKSLGEIGHF